MTDDERALLLLVAKAVIQEGADSLSRVRFGNVEDLGIRPSLWDGYAALRRVDPEYTIPSLENILAQKS